MTHAKLREPDCTAGRESDSKIFRSVGAVHTHVWVCDGWVVDGYGRCVGRA